jgi:hypothetical protein
MRDTTNHGAAVPTPPAHIHQPRKAAVAVSKEAPMTEFAAMAYPATDADKAICAAALAAVEQSGSLSSMEHLDALLLATHPGWCKAFLDKRGQAAFDAACKSAPPALFVGQGQSIRWKDCRDHLESLGAIVLDRSTRDQPISKSIALATSKAAFPTGVDEVVKFALQALARIRELRKDLSSRALDGSAPGGSEVGDEALLRLDSSPAHTPAPKGETTCACGHGKAEHGNGADDLTPCWCYVCPCAEYDAAKTEILQRLKSHRADLARLARELEEARGRENHALARLDAARAELAEALEELADFRKGVTMSAEAWNDYTTRLSDARIQRQRADKLLATLSQMCGDA